MKILSTSLILVAALAAPLAAQKMGSSNRGAPTLEHSIEFANGNEVEVDYVALNWAEGKFAERAKASAEFREFVNNNAKENPVGTFETSADVMVGDKTVKAGEYGLHFLITEEGGWQMVLSQKDDEGKVTMTTWDLALTETEAHKQRLSIVISAAAETDACALELHFGNMATTIAVKPAAEAPEQK